MKADKVINRSNVYKALYYSGFEWERDEKNRDHYTLKGIFGKYEIFHEAAGNYHDKLIIKNFKNAKEVDKDKLERLLIKIQNRSTNLEVIKM